MATFNSLVEAQRYARDNEIDKYWRIVFGDNKHGAGGWLAELNPRERFYAQLPQMETDVLTFLRAGRTFQVSTVWTNETSDSVNAK